MFTVVMKTLSVITLLATMIIGTGNERSTISDSRTERPDNRSDIRISPIDGKVVPTEMNYQGYLILSSSSTPVTGELDMFFELYISETGGTPFWTETHYNVPVEDGIFNVILGSTTSLDPDDFSGVPLWLQITVGTEVLTPRKKIVSTAYSVRALYSDTAEYAFNGTLSDNDWTIVGNVLYPFAQYGLAMFGNILHGSNSNTHVNLGVGGTTGLSGLNYAYCTVGGGSKNISSASYSTVGGGRENISSGEYSTVGGGYGNNSYGDTSTVGGGCYNRSGNNSTVGGGYQNTSSDSCATVSGGYNNTSSERYSTIGGGLGNTSSGWYSTIGGGGNNISYGSRSTVGGGCNNTSSGDYSTIGGGKYNTSSVTSSTVGGGSNNTSSGGGATVGGGYYNISSHLFYFTS